MHLPTLNAPAWDMTIAALHRAAMLFGPVHNALRTPQKNYLHLPLQIQPWGLSSGALPKGGEISLHFEKAALHYRRPNGEIVAFSLQQHTQADLFKGLLEAMKADELAEFYRDVQDSDVIAAMMTKLHADPTRVEFLKLEEVTHTDSLSIDSALAADYAAALYTVFTGVARFRARLNGHMTPIVVWAEHFDLSTLWFLDGAMDDQKAHMNFGFAPFSNGLPRPYLYTYAYPYPAEMEVPALPQPARWHTSGWTGVVVDYDDLVTAEDPAAQVEALCLGIFAALRPLLGHPASGE